MQKYDYNILTSLLELPSKVKFFNQDARNEIFNIDLPEKEELFKRINELINLELIYPMDIDNNLIKNKIITEQDKNIILYLSAKGGKELEKRLNIVWDKFTYEEVGYYAENIFEVTIQSSSLDNLNKALSYLPEKFKRQDIKMLSPWFPVYWKKMPIGYKFSMPVSEVYYRSNLENNKNYLDLVNPSLIIGKQ